MRYRHRGTNRTSIPDTVSKVIHCRGRRADHKALLSSRPGGE